MNKRIIKILIISVFVGLYLLTSSISMINSVDFFMLSQSKKMSWILAIAFELGAAASLCSLVILDKINKNIVWLLFISLTLFQIMNNVYHSYIHLHDYQGWIELFGLSEEDIIYQKRILSLVKGILLPLIALGFIKALIDYVKPKEDIYKPEITVIKEETQKPNESIENINEYLKKKTETTDIIEEPVNSIEEPITTTENNINEIEEDIFIGEPIEITNLLDDENLEKMVEHKKKLIESLRVPYLNLLLFLYRGGEVVPGDELASYTEFLKIVPKGEYTESQIKNFLTFCNYLDVFKISGTHKIALKSYADAIETFTKYFKWG